MTRKVSHAHQLVAQVARECANELYEAMMHDNAIRAAWVRRCGDGCSEPARRARFEAEYWPRCIGIARATLARLCANPTIAPERKEEIMEALVLDGTLMRGRREPQEVLSETTSH